MLGEMRPPPAEALRPRRAITGRLDRQLVTGLPKRLAMVARYLASGFARRDPRVWVFGNVNGFRDNPRYLAEHIVHERPELQAWWIARSPAEAEAARSAGLHVASRGRAGGRVQRRARVAFLANGFQDLQADQLRGAYVVELRHGKGLKRIFLDVEVPDDVMRSAPRRALLRLQRWLVARRLAQVNMIVAPGQMARRMYATAFGGSPERIRVLGSPRFDVILGGPAYRRVAGADLRRELGLEPDDFVVLWLPTWRREGDAAWLPHLDADQLAASLADTRVMVLAKPHPYSDRDVFAERLAAGPRLRLLPDDATDVNALLRLADALVTDYSSAAFDYAVLDRPLYFFTPDLEQYRGGRGLYEPLEGLTGGEQHRDWPSLLTALREASTGNTTAGLRLARVFRERAQLDDRPGSCERIVAEVAREIGLE